MIKIKINSFEISYKNTIIDYLNEVSICKFVDGEELTDITIEILKHKGSSYYDIKRDDVFIYLEENGKNNHSFLRRVCDIIIEVFDIESINFDLRLKNIDNISDINDKLTANYDKIGNTYSRGKDDPYISLDTIKASKGSNVYFVRRSLGDSASEKYCGESLTQAIMECDKHTGYKVYSDKGNAVYTSRMYKVDLNSDIKAEKQLMYIRNRGAGIQVKDGNIPINIPDGTEVIVSKISSKISEIEIHLNGRKIKTEVATSILSKM